MAWPDIASLVPHRAPMLLLDAVTGIEDRMIECSTLVSDACVFVEDGRADALLCIELVAQAVAAYVGYAAIAAGGRPTVGLLISCRDATFETDALAVGDRLKIVARHVWGDANLASFRGHVERDGARVAAVELGVYRGPIPRDGVPS